MTDFQTVVNEALVLDEDPDEVAVYDPRLSELRQAIEDHGPVPAIHMRQMHRLKNEWPTLWRAIQHLLYPSTREENDHLKLYGEFDASVWAREFIKIVRDHPHVAKDEGAMTGWFANAIMTGYDQAQREVRDSLEEARDA